MTAMIRTVGLGSMALSLLLATGRHAVAATPIVVRDADVGVRIDPDSGAILCVQDDASGLCLEPTPGLAESFRLVLRQPDDTVVTIVGTAQGTSSRRTGDGTLTMRCDAPLTDTTGGTHDVDVEMRLTAEDGALTFALRAENRTEGQLEQVWYPYIGGLATLSDPGERGPSIWVPTSSPWQREVTTPFADAQFGYPGQMNMSFTCIQCSHDPARSLYFASHDTIARHKTYHFVELDEPDGSDVFAALRHVPHTRPGHVFEGSPVLLRFVDGDWRRAGQVYRGWFDHTFGITRPEDDWIRRQSFFLMTMFMLPEGTINLTFRDIPRWARAAKRHGIDAVQISGWNRGGHDNGYPDYSIDPRLGTWEELEDGIRRCHAMGMRVFFFVNFHPMMVESEWYKTELHKYREMAPDGGLTWLAGWGMGTLQARTGASKKMTWADLGFPEFRKIIVEHFAKLARIGADGVHVDKFYPSAMSFNPDSPLAPDTSTWEGAILLADEVMQECRRHNPDWAMSFECNWDRVLEFGAATWWVGNQSITRQVFPENAETLALSQAYDYLRVNDAVRDGHAVMVVPLNFCAGVDWPPFRALADYIKTVKRIRDRLQDAVFFGDVLGATGVDLEGTDQRGIDYNVFRDRSTGQRVCIVTNRGLADRTVGFGGFGGERSSRGRVHTPFRRPANIRAPAEVTVPGERLVFIEELGGKP